MCYFIGVVLKTIFKIAVYCFAAVGFILVSGYVAVRFGLTNDAGIIDRQSEFFQKSGRKPAWAEGEEWRVFSAAALKDKGTIDKAAKAAGVEARLIAAELAVEQLRLYYSNRELFKRVFAPLKLLGDQSQFSWGVMGIKPETAGQIEEKMKNPASPFYPGKEYEHALDFVTKNPDEERFNRLTDEKDRFYSYLYAALYTRELITQWRNAGYDIGARPEIIATLFNIGFERSVPKPDPRSGGAEIKISAETYSFGGLAAEFYNSDELLESFPRKGNRS